MTAVAVAEPPVVSLTCGSCGMAWDVRPRADGSWPGGARCPRDRGGCGTYRKIPAARSASTTQVRATAAAAAAWEPPSEPRRPRESADPCPRCGGITHASPRGTVRVCLGCRTRVTPPAVLAPYQRDGTTAARAVKSQRERDLEALSLARRKGLMLGQLAALAADERLDPASLPVVEWFREQVKDAASDGRLDELAALLPEAGIRRRHWWHGQPAAITAGYPDEDDEDQADELAAAPLAAPASLAAQPGRAAVDYAAELAAREWRWEPHGAGLCQLIHMKPHGWDYVPPQECINRAEHAIPGGAVCGSCYYALNQPLVRRGRG